jgi:hypothetical protein
MVTARTRQPFVSDSIRSRFGHGVLLCDPYKLNKFLKGNANGRDLNDVFFSDAEKNVYSEGIAVALFDHYYEECKVTVRDARSTSNITRTASKVSDGWILESTRGQLVMCSIDALLFWHPFEIDEDPQRYVRFVVPRGWYQVTVRLQKRSDDDQEWEDNAEFVLTRKRERPKFSAMPFADNSSEEVVVSGSNPNSAEKPTDVVRAVDADLIKAVLSKLTPAAFDTFVTKLFDPDEEGGYDQTPQELGEGVFYQSLIDSYGGTLHSVFLLQYLPLGLFNQPNLNCLAGDPTLAARLKQLKKIYNGVSGYFGMVSPELVKATKLRSLGFLVNFSGLSQRQYDDEIFPQYERLVRKSGLHTPITLIGSYDSFMDFHARDVQKTLEHFLTSRTDGFAIQISPAGTNVINFAGQTSFESGVLAVNKCPYEPIIAAASAKNEQLIREFESLIQKDCPEKERENFLLAHVKEIFGGTYDKIESQIWLRFPKLDIAGKERRMDIFMRNSVSKDWDLFEIKNPIPLVRNYRGIPAMVAEVSIAITQLKNYRRLLSSQKVKETLKRSGIEYCEPTLNLVIGRKPQISLEQWRWLLSSQDKDVRLITFDDLFAEMKIRLADHARFIERLKIDYS